MTGSPAWGHGAISVDAPEKGYCEIAARRLAQGSLFGVPE